VGRAPLDSKHRGASGYSRYPGAGFNSPVGARGRRCRIPVVPCPHISVRLGSGMSPDRGASTCDFVGERRELAGNVLLDRHRREGPKSSNPGATRPTSSRRTPDAAGVKVRAGRPPPRAGLIIQRGVGLGRHGPERGRWTSVGIVKIGRSCAIGDAYFMSPVIRRSPPPRIGGRQILGSCGTSQQDDCPRATGIRERERAVVSISRGNR
jgi:hypothetical protein